jgi:glycerol-1-phosphate dehydrogenase [NAD(P)+]
LVRVKPDALARLGTYLARDQRKNVRVLVSEGLPTSLLDLASRGLQEQGIESHDWVSVEDNSLEACARYFEKCPSKLDAIVGIGGGKALDVAKYISFLGRWPYYSVPTSLSNDGFCSPQSSLQIGGKRRSLASAIPYGVIIDTKVCLDAPRILNLAGVGDLVSKFTAVRDWKLAFHASGEPVNDFSALLSDGSIHSFMSYPHFDEEGIRLLATALLLNGVSMEMCGSSRPASGSEHLISHALDATSTRPRLHGLQVGMATYLMSHLQDANTDRIEALFDATGFWDAIAEDPFSRSEWLQAIRVAPSIKPGYYTILSTADTQPKIEKLFATDPHLLSCFLE